MSNRSITLRTIGCAKRRQVRNVSRVEVYKLGALLILVNASWYKSNARERLDSACEENKLREQKC